MRLRKRYLPLVALLGAALAVIPAMASSTGSSTATVSGLESIMWSPMEVAITPAGTVTFQNASSSVPHGIVWKSGPETPVCSGVPIDEGKTDWQGNCTFSKEGTYEYYCYVHGTNMSGTIYVNPTGTVPTTTGATPTTTTTTMPTTTTPRGGSPPGGGTAGGQQSPGPTDSLRGGTVQLASSQRGKSIRGSVQVAQSGSKLMVEVLVSAARLAVARQHQLLVGRLVRASLTAGRVRFSVALDGRATRVLRRRRLPVTVRLTLTAPGGSTSTRTISVVLRRS